jgi:hypothetical protein
MAHDGNCDTEGHASIACLFPTPLLLTLIKGWISSIVEVFSFATSPVGIRDAKR